MNCFICKADLEEVENLIGVEFSPLDQKLNQKRDDVFLCNECIEKAYAILKRQEIRNIVSETIRNLTESQDNEN